MSLGFSAASSPEREGLQVSGDRSVHWSRGVTLQHEPRAGPRGVADAGESVEEPGQLGSTAFTSRASAMPVESWPDRMQYAPDIEVEQREVTHG